MFSPCVAATGLLVAAVAGWSCSNPLTVERQVTALQIALQPLHDAGLLSITATLEEGQGLSDGQGIVGELSVNGGPARSIRLRFCKSDTAQVVCNQVAVVVTSPAAIAELTPLLDSLSAAVRLLQSNQGGFVENGGGVLAIVQLFSNSLTGADVQHLSDRIADHAVVLHAEPNFVLQSGDADLSINPIVPRADLLTGLDGDYQSESIPDVQGGDVVNVSYRNPDGTVVEASLGIP